MGSRTALSCLGMMLILSNAPGVQAQAIEPSIVLGKPTTSSITINALADNGQVSFEYGTASGSYTESTATVEFLDGPIELELTGLAADTAYFYRALYTVVGESSPTASEEYRFHTQRQRGSEFTFTIQADSHQGFAPFYSEDLYATALSNVLQDAPDFHIDLGDAFSLDGSSETEASIYQKYLNQRDAFSLVGHSAPIFLVLGNHENEEGWNLDDRGSVADSVPVMGANARKRFFANPVPSGGPNPFYTGNEDTSTIGITGDGLKEDYYAFEWGDALFVAIDPFWYTMVKPFSGTTGGEANDEVVGNRWDWTLGEAQYEWLRQTLENSDASHKFVFAHHLVGGTEDYSRGGAQGAPYCEWGGFNIDGVTWGFDEQRPNLVMPIHDLLLANGVSIFFHGHDHVYVTEELDGIVYQECPHVANDDYGTGFISNETNYSPFELVNNSGHLRVTVNAAQAQVEYVRAYLDGDGPNRYVEASYTTSPLPLNTKPTIGPDFATTTEEAPVVIDVLDNDADADSDPLTIAGVSQPTNGIAENRGTDVYYIPDPGYCDEEIPDTFRYAVKDGRGGSRTTTVSITVQCGVVNAPPQAVDDSAETLSGQAIVLNLLSNDLDPEGELDPNSFRITVAPSSGVVDPLGGGVIRYTPNSGYVGTEIFEYEICDLAEACADAEVIVSVIGCVSAADCADDDPCSIESCNAGLCNYTSLDCDDGDACTVDSCSEEGTCENTPLDCTDLFDCTVDTCVDGACLHNADDAACTQDQCNTSICQPLNESADPRGCVTTAVDCDDSDLCTQDTCNPNSGCMNTPLTCEDGNLCTLNACTPELGCTYSERPCDDGNSCTEDTCDPLGGCLNVPRDGLCDDSDPCTIDSCGPSGCQHVPLDCDDGNLCTTDLCEAGACRNLLVECGADACRTSSCDPETGACGGPPLDCDDGNPCTEDRCDQSAGCIHTPVQCNQGTRCAPQTCNAETGRCEAVEADCDDANPCTDDRCDEDVGCTHEPNDSECNDDNPCTTKDSCREGSCAGFTLDCTALDSECSIGVCDPEQGPVCVAQPRRDGAECSGGTCIDGACVERTTDGGSLDQGHDAGQTTPHVADAATPDHTEAGTTELGPLTTPDGGPAPIDAGMAHDAGPEAPDANLAIRTLPLDPDGGLPAVNSPEGCHCRVVNSAPVPPLHLGWLLLAVTALGARRVRPDQDTPGIGNRHGRRETFS